MSLTVGGDAPVPGDLWWP